jgi:hypothetical protein
VKDPLIILFPHLIRKKKKKKKRKKERGKQESKHVNIGEGKGV